MDRKKEKKKKEQFSGVYAPLERSVAFGSLLCESLSPRVCLCVWWIAPLPPSLQLCNELSETQCSKARSYPDVDIRASSALIRSMMETPEIKISLLFSLSHLFIFIYIDSFIVLNRICAAVECRDGFVILVACAGADSAMHRLRFQFAVFSDQQRPAPNLSTVWPHFQVNLQLIAVKLLSFYIA